MTIKLTTLDKIPHLYKDVIELIESSFNYSYEFSFSVDFFTLMQPSNHQNCYVLLDDKIVIGHLAYLPKKLMLNKVITDACFIGGIAVREEYRGQKLFSKMYDESINLYKDKYSLFLLWSDKADLYSRYGFVEFDQVYQLGNSDIVTHDLDFRKEETRDLSIRDIDSLLSLYTQNFRDIIVPYRNVDDFKSLFNIESSALYIQRDSNQLITNYFFINKGFDLNEVIHECSFHNDKKLMKKFSNFKLWSPHQAQASSHVIFLGLIKIGNPSSFITFIEEIFNGDLIISELNEHKAVFTFKNVTYSLDITNFIHKVFGPGKAEEFSAYNTDVFIPGLDSI